MQKDVTVILRGPLNVKSLQNVHAYLSYADVVVSYWNDKSIPDLELQYLDKACNLGAIAVVNKYEDVDLAIPRTFQSYMTSPFLTYYKTLANLSGLHLTDTRHTILIRSDSSYPDLKPFHKKCLTSNKVVCLNIGFRPDAIFRYHPGDHVIAGNTKHLQEGFELSRQIIEMCPNTKGILDTFKKDKLTNVGAALYPEQLLGVSLLISKGVPPKYLSKESSKKLMIDMFDVVNISELGEYQWTSGFVRSYFKGEVRYLTTSSEDADLYNSITSSNRGLKSIATMEDF